jgi:hypothetical protein
MRFMPGGDEDTFKMAVAELGAVSLDGVLADIERGEAEDAVSGGGGPGLSAGGPIAQDHRNAALRGGAQIGQLAGEGACGGGTRRLGEQSRTCAQAQRSKHKRRNRTPPSFRHLNTDFRAIPISEQNQGEYAKHCRPALTAGPGWN